jgi:hypothetical protein
MAIAILDTWRNYFDVSRAEGLGSSYERVVLNRKLDAVRRQYKVRTLLEAPAFGFTGLSGINSMGLARIGVAVSLLDHDRERVRRIQEVWQEVGLPVDAQVVDGYESLPYPAGCFDMSWNFAAIWFVRQMDRFLSELARVTSKVVIIGVPNRAGLGYFLEKGIAGPDLGSVIDESHIIPSNIVDSMAGLGWMLVEHSYVDVPPWPDIGMKKEDFFRIINPAGRAIEQDPAVPSHPLTIMDYYTGLDPTFERKMLRYGWLERFAPRFFKAVWAHHRLLRFEPRRAG